VDKALTCLAAIERRVTLVKTDAETNFGFHLIGRDPMIISTIEPGTMITKLGLTAQLHIPVSMWYLCCVMHAGAKRCIATVGLYMVSLSVTSKYCVRESN